MFNLTFIIFKSIIQFANKDSEFTEVFFFRN